MTFNMQVSHEYFVLHRNECYCEACAAGEQLRQCSENFFFGYMQTQAAVHERTDCLGAPLSEVSSDFVHSLGKFGVER